MLKKNALRLVGLLIVIAIFGLLIFGLYKAYRPVPDEIQGMVDGDEIRIGAKVPGRLEALYAAEGADVKAGQLLGVLSSPELDAKAAGTRAQQAAAESQQAKADHGAQSQDIAASHAAWQAARANATLGAATQTRMQRLYAEGVISLQRRDEAAAAATATAQIAEAAHQQYLKVASGTRVEDKLGAAALNRQANAGVAEVSALQAELQIVAPQAGQIALRTAHVGEIVPPGWPVFTLINLQDLWVSFNVRENQFHGLRPGQNIVGRVPALNMQQIQFKVDYISPRGDFATWRAVRQSEGYDIKTFEVRARPATVIPGLRPGMSVLFSWPQG